MCVYVVVCLCVCVWCACALCVGVCASYDRPNVNVLFLQKHIARRSTTTTTQHTRPIHTTQKPTVAHPAPTNCQTRTHKPSHAHSQRHKQAIPTHNDAHHTTHIHTHNDAHGHTTHIRTHNDIGFLSRWKFALDLLKLCQRSNPGDQFSIIHCRRAGGSVCGCRRASRHAQFLRHNTHTRAPPNHTHHTQHRHNDP